MNLSNVSHLRMMTLYLKMYMKLAIHLVETTTNI